MLASQAAVALAQLVPFASDLGDCLPIGRRLDFGFELTLDGIKLQDAIERYERREASAKDAAKELGIGEATFYRHLKENREPQ